MLQPIASRINRLRHRGDAGWRGQTTLEYAVFTAVVAAAVLGMGLYVRRAIQANLQAVQDRINAEAVP